MTNIGVRTRQYQGYTCMYFHTLLLLHVVKEGWQFVSINMTDTQSRHQLHVYTRVSGDEPPAVLYNSGCEYGMRHVHIEIEPISSGFYSDLSLLTLKWNLFAHDHV